MDTIKVVTELMAGLAISHTSLRNLEKKKCNKHGSKHCNDHA
jgi:hypothetical protein